MADNISLRIQKTFNLLIWLSLIVMFFVPENYIIGGGPSLCLHKLLTGYPCPLCGLTKATWSLSHFQWLRAFSFNPVIYLLLTVQIIWTVQLWTKIKMNKWLRYSLYLLLVAFVTLYMIRFF
jgi:hypothetical protein